MGDNMTLQNARKQRDASCRALRQATQGVREARRERKPERKLWLKQGLCSSAYNTRDYVRAIYHG